MLAVACLIGLWTLSRVFKHQGFPPGLEIDLLLAMVIGGLLGARVAYVLVYRFDVFIADPLYMLKFTGSGLMWYGGLIIGFLAFWVTLRLKGLPFWEVADATVPFVALGYSIVRGGCFLAGCCYGHPTDSPWGVIFHIVDELPRWPTQLFSSGLGLLIFLILLLNFRNRTFSGQTTSLYLILYALYRFGIEFLRASEVYYGPLAPSQIGSLALFLIGVLCYLYNRRQNRYQTTYSRRIDRFYY